MDELPPYLLTLFSERRVSRSQLPARSKGLLRPLFDGGVLEIEPAGRGEVVVVRQAEAFASWIGQNFPSFGNRWQVPVGASRAQSLALRRDTKATGLGVSRSVLHLRAWGSAASRVTLDSVELPVVELSAKHGIAACLIDANAQMSFEGPVALMENLECFLRAEDIISSVSIALNSAGRISDRLIACLARSRFDAPPLLHLPDYDPVGLSDYLRLREALAERVNLFVPSDLEERFTAFGNRKLIAEKARSRALLEQLEGSVWPCEQSRRVYELIKETGSGLEQESLLLKLGKR
jgi:hypothetical protein